MACDTINPKWMDTGVITGTVIRTDTGEILSFGDGGTKRDFMLEIVEGPKEQQRSVVDLIYSETQRIVLLVRERLEREKPIETTLINAAEGSEFDGNE